MSDDLLMHLVFISFPTQYGKFIVSYNTENDKWTLNELISHCMREEDWLKRDKTESAHVATTSKVNNQKRTKYKETAVGRSQPKKQKTRDQAISCFFCKKSGHVKMSQIRLLACEER